MAFPLLQNTGNSILWGLLKNPRGIFKKDDLGVELAQIALPAALALTADPIASLIDTAFIGHIEMRGGGHKKRHLSSASSAIIVGGALGLTGAVILICAAKPMLSYMGVQSDSHMFSPALQYLILRSLGAPAVFLSVAMQGVFRGFKDTKTPLYATMIGDVVNIVLDPIFIFLFKMGVSGAAIAHVISQCLISMVLLWGLMRKVYLLPPTI